MTFAGVLPGIFHLRNIDSKFSERSSANTVQLVIQAEEKVRHMESLPENTPIIILGGKGFVGSRIIER